MLGSAPRRSLSVALVMTAMLLTACGGSAPPAAPTTAPKPTEAAKPATAPAAASPAAPAASPAAAAASPAVAASPAASPAAAASPTVNGEVDSVDGRLLSVITNTGVRKVRVADNATILVEGEGSPVDLKPGPAVAVT